MSAFERAARLFEQVSGVPAAEREALLASEQDAEVRALVRDLIDRHADVSTGLSGIGELVEGALESEAAWASSASRLDLSNSPYRVLGLLARGGMGVVLRGHDTEIGRDVAIKVLPSPESESARLRFIEEAQVAGQLEHPGIVPIYQLGNDDAGRPFFAMKLVAGDTLATLLDAREGPHQNRSRLLGYFLQVCHTVAYAHSRRVIHRDLKPANVMVGSFGEVQVLDWGLAKVLGSEPRTPSAEGVPGERGSAPATVRTGDGPGSASITGTVMGTPRYMSPEQARGQVEQLDRRSDVFSLGAILCEILTGAPPFPGNRGEALEEARAGNVGAAYDRLDRCAGEAAIVALAKKCLAEEPGDRPPHASVIAAEIERSFADTEERARSAELEAEAARARATSERRARRLSVWLSASAALFVVTLSAFFLWRDVEQRRATSQRSEEVDEALSLVATRFEEARRTDPADRAPWDAAGLALDSAESLAASGRVSDSTSARLRRTRAHFDSEREASARAARTLARNRAMLRRLDEIRSPTGDGVDPYDYPRIESGYRAAFDEYGIDIEDPNAAALLTQSAIAEQLGQALDQWALCRHTMPDGNSLERKAPTERLLRLASEADTDAVRVRVRDALCDSDAVALRALAGEASQLPPGSILLIANGLDVIGDTAAAVALLQSAVHRYPGDFWLSMSTALALRRVHGVGSPEAVPYFYGALGARPQSGAAHHYLGQNLMASGRPEEARAVFLALTELAPEDGHAWAHLGEIIIAREGWSAALATLEQAASTAPDDPYALTWYGRALEETGSLWEAVLPLRQAFELDRTSTHAARLADVLGWTGASRASYEMYEEALAMGGEEWTTLYNAGTSARSLGKLDRAEELLRRSVDLFPDIPQVHCNLAAVLCDLGRYEEALDLYARCDELGRRDPQWPYPSEAWIGRTERAVRIADELDDLTARPFDPSHPLAFDRADVALTLGRTATSSDWFARILERQERPVLADVERAAQAAARASGGDGVDARELSDEERRLHGDRALTWLELIRSRLMEDFRLDPDRELQAARGWFDSWRVSPAFAHLRWTELEQPNDGPLQKRARSVWKRVAEAEAEIERTFDLRASPRPSDR